jgi:hypothetical protein
MADEKRPKKIKQGYQNPADKFEDEPAAAGLIA